MPAEDAVRPVKHCAVTIGLSISTKQNKQEKTFSLQITNLPPWQNPGWEIFFRNSQLLFSLPHKSLQNKKDLENQTIPKPLDLTIISDDYYADFFTANTKNCSYHRINEYTDQMRCILAAFPAL